MQRIGAVRRWFGVAAVGAVVVAIPGIVSGRPVSARHEPATALVALARASADVSYSGYVQTSGALGLPQLGWLKEPGALLGSTSRLRVWWRDHTHYRVDQLSVAGERDRYRDDSVVTLWDSGRLVVTRSGASDQPHLPTTVDLTPPELARRLLGPATDGELRSGGLTRVAGRAAQRVDVLPADHRSLAGRISVWVDTASGLPLRVVVVPRGSRQPVLTSGFLELRLGQPPASALLLRPPPDAQYAFADGSSVTDLAYRFAAAPLPARLGDLPRRDDVPSGTVDARGRSTGEIATYRRDYVVVAVMPLRSFDAQTLVDRYASPVHPIIRRPYGSQISLGTPLLSALLVVGVDRGLALVGTVSSRQLDAFAAELLGGGG